MKHISPLPILLLVLFSAFTLAGFSQQVIGSFPYMDGGFEGQTSGALANTLSTTAWTRQSVTGASSSIIATSPRTGLKYATITNVASVSRGLQSPQTATAANGPAASTSYTIQYFIKNPSIGTYTESINTNGTTNTAYGTAVTVAANASWTKRTVTQTSSATAVSTAGILVTARSASAVTFDIDDVVLYAGAVDNTAANSPGTVTVNGATTTTLNVSWVAASGGVDGGGYVVVRYASSPGANDDPNVNGIYAVGNTVTGGVSGTVAYVGTGISFTDNLPLLANTTYYYKVYTVDKAFNYSAETTGNASTLAYSNPTTSSISPTFANAGASSFTITVNGTNFLNGFSTVTWNGSNRTTTFVSATQLTATIPSGDITTQGTANVGVTTTGAVSASGTQTFTINAAGGAAQTINFPTFLGKTYGDASFDPGANATSGLAVSYASDNNAVASISGINIVINGPGTANITASQGGNGFYAPAPDVVQEISVLAKPLTVTGAVAENKIYDGGTAATITGYSIVETLVGADVVTVSGGGTFASSSVGTGIAVTAALSLGGAQAAKYSLTQPTGLTANIIAPILAWEFNTKAGNEVTVASTTTDANLNTSTISRGAGITATALPNGFSSSTYTVSGTLANAVTNNQYMQFTVNPKPGYQTSLSSLDANLRRSATGPNAYQWKYSLDGFATAGVDIGSPVSYTLTTSAGDPQTQINLSGISALQNIQTVSTVTFRLYPYGATNTGGTFALGLPTTPVNDLAIGGTTSVAPTPDIIISNAHPAIGTVDQGTVDHIIGEFFVDINTANAYLTGVSVTTAGTYQSADITNIKFWVNNLNTLVGATQIGTTQAAVGNGGTASVSGLATTIPSGSNRYIIVTASVAGNAVPGRTIRLASTAFANIQFASGNKTGTNPVASSNDQTITQLDPTIAISNASLTASSINQNSTNQMVHSIKLDVTVTSATVTSVTMEPSGTYQSTDLVPNSLKFWINTTNNLTGATQLGTSQAIVNAGDPVSVSGLSQVLNINSTYYLILTADVAFNAVAGRTLLVGSTNFSNLIFASSNKTGTDPVAGGNTRTFAAVVPSITISGTATTSTTIGAPSTNNVIYQFSVAPTVNSAQLSLMTLPLTGTYINTNISASGMKLWYNSTNTFGTATQIKTANIVNTGGNLLFTGLTQTVTISTTGFFWVTADISASATAGKTIKVNTVSNSAFTFTQGTVSGTPPSGGTFTFLPQPTITEVILPQYMQGNTATNSTRIPYVFRLKIGNLSPSATYRYYNSVVNSSDGTTGTGAGNIVYPLASGYIPGAQSLSTAGSYNTFLTNASGEYTGWFMVEPTGNARFTPGASINMRIQLNDGSTGTTVSSRVTTTSTITVINFATSAGAANGTGIRGTSSGTAKNIVVLYDNVSGSGRPLSAAAIESDGFTQVANYPTYYSSSVEAFAGAWGTIIPNTLSNGVRRIEQRDLATGSLLNCPNVTVNGTWPSGVNTVNPTGGNTTILVVSSTDAPLNSSASTWLGVSNDWNSGANWVCGVPNSSTADVVIPANSPIMPLVKSNTSVRNLTLSGSSTVDLGVKTLNIYGAVTGTGTIKGSQNSDLTISGAAGTINLTNGFRELKNLTLTSGATATLGTTLDITSANLGGTVIVGSGATLTTGGNLTIKSSLNGTASVGNSAGTITGNVTVERFIPQNAFRAWRMLSVPVQGSQTFKQSWQENQAPLVNGNPGYGTIVTSSAGGNGYDAASGNSLLSFANGNPGTFTAVSNTNNAMATTSGYFVFIRGNRSTGIQAGVFNPTATTLRTNGTLYTGTQTAITLPAGQNVMVGNVYAAPIDFDVMTKSGTSAFKVWDPKFAGTSNAGGYQTFSSTNGYVAVPGGGSYGNTPNSRIESGAAFIVTSTGGGSIQLTEAAKVTGSKNVFRPSGIIQQLKTRLYSVGNDGEEVMADGNAVVFNNDFSNELDNEDVVKTNNPAENIGIANGSTNLVIDARKPIVETDVITFQVANLKQQVYMLEFIPSNIKADLKAYIEDKYLGTKTAMNLTETSKVIFKVDNNAASSASDRFRIVFASKNTQPAVTIDEETIGTIKILPTLVTGKTFTIQMNNQPKGKYSVNLLNNLGQIVYSGVINTSGGNSTHSVLLNSAVLSGVHQVEIKGSNNKRMVEKIVISNK